MSDILDLTFLSFKKKIYIHIMHIIKMQKKKKKEKWDEGRMFKRQQYVCELTPCCFQLLIIAKILCNMKFMVSYWKQKLLSQVSQL